MSAATEQIGLDFPQIWDLFGSSIYRDEYRGDFREAKSAIHAAFQDSDPDQAEVKAKIQILLALSGLLAGKVDAAEIVLNSLRNDETLAPNLRLRAENNRKLIIQNGSLLHAFDNCLDLPDFETNIQKASHRERLQRDVRLQVFRTDQTDFEDSWIQMNILSLKVKTAAATIHPRSPIHPREAAQLGSNSDLVANVDRVLATYNLGYPHRLRAEIAHLQGSETASAIMNAAQRAYCAKSDIVGEASCILAQGDWLASPRYTNITALNIIICEGTGYNGCSQWDNLEDEFAPPDVQVCQPYYDEAMRLFQKADSKRGIAAVFNRRACVLMIALIWSDREEIQPNPSAASEVLHNLIEAMDYSERAGDWPAVQLTRIYKLIWSILHSTREVDLSVAAYIGSWGLHSGSFQYAHDLGLLLLRLGNFLWRNRRLLDESLALLEGAQALFEQLGAKGTQIQAQAARADILGQTLDLVPARRLFLDAEVKVRELSRSLSGVWDNGPWKPPLETFTESLLGAMSTTLFYVGDANSVRRIANELEETSGDLNLREATKAQAVLYEIKLRYRQNLRRNDPTKASECLERGLEELRWLSSAETGNAAEVAQVNLCTEMSRYDEAKSALRRMHDKIEAGADPWTASLYTFNPLFRAIMLKKQARVLFWSSLSAHDFELANQYKQQLEVLEQESAATCIFDRTPPRRTASDMLGEGLLLEGLGKLKEALAMVQTAIDAVDSEWYHIADPDHRLQGFNHSDTAEMFNAAIRICFKLADQSSREESATDKPETENPSVPWELQSLLFAERGKARSVLEAVRSNSKDDLATSKHVADFQRQLVRVRKSMEQNLKDAKALAALQEQSPIGSGAIATDIHKIQRTIISAQEAEKRSADRVTHEESMLRTIKQSAMLSHPHLPISGARVSFKVSDLHQLQLRIPERTAVIEFSTMAEGFAVFVITSTGVQWSDWVPFAYRDLQRLVLDFLFCMNRNRLQRRDRVGKLRRSIKELSKVLISPIEPYLTHVDSLIIVPSGCLFNLPFGVLETQGKLLVLSHAITQIPSLSIWNEVHGRKDTGSSKKAVFGNSNAISDLQYGRIESLVLSKRLDTEIHVADHLSMSQFEEIASSCEVVQVSAHGRFDHDAPLLSRIKVLDGNLSIIDLASVLGPAKLVVFSACFSGFGKVLGSNDVHSFAQAMLSIGVRTFLGSLWAADDGSSLILMWMFYDFLADAEDPQSIAQALRRAQVALLTMSPSKLNEIVDQITEVFQGLDEITRDRVIGTHLGRYWLDQLRATDVTLWKDLFYWAPFSLVGDALHALYKSLGDSSVGGDGNRAHD